MTLNEYQQQAMTTCMPSSDNFSYMMLNLVGEVGEFIDKVESHIAPTEVWSRLMDVIEKADDCGTLAKMIRKGEYVVNNLDPTDMTEQESLDLQKEAGDILWQLAGLCHVMGWNLEDIARQNLAKLASRKERNVIDGNGDNR